MNVAALRRVVWLMMLSVAMTWGAAGKDPVPKPAVRTMVMRSDWQLQSAADCGSGGAEISMSGFDRGNWIPATVPSTVLGSLGKARRFPDPFFGKNLEKIPAGIFQGAWWYRREFDVAPGEVDSAARLIFEGINYRANIWLNGKRIASSDTTCGAFRIFEFDVTKMLRSGRNALAAEVFPPRAGEFTLGFVDWNPRPPDNSLGLFREVKLRFSGPVSVEHLFVTSRLSTNREFYADLTVRAELVNHGTGAVQVRIGGEIENRRFSERFSLDPGSRREIVFTAERFSQLRIRNPRLWWPHTLGKPELYGLAMTVALDGAIDSDRQEIRFGIREVSDYLNEQGHRGYKVNGRKVLIRGGGWVDDLFLNEDEKKLEAQVRYCRHMNLNAIRLEGFWGCSQALYDLADRYGILLLAGWSCQWEWENYLGKPVDENFGGILAIEDMKLAADYWNDQVLWLRHHPSILVWVLQSDLLPKPELERAYRSILDRLDPSRPVLASCKSHVSQVSGPTAVKMSGPYDYVTPNYWYVDTQNGGAFGFNTETGPGPQPPPEEGIRRMIPEGHLWPIDDMWNFHCARNEFSSMGRYVLAFDKRYGPAASLEEFAFKAQAANYEAMRPMFEAFRINRPTATGVIQWMYNSAWPKLFWQLYDYELLPTGAFYGARQANRPLQLAYHYGNRSIHALNDTLQPAHNVRADVRLFGQDSRPLGFWERGVRIPAGESVKVMDLPPLPSGEGVYFLSLKLFNIQGTKLADNFYWLSGSEDVLDGAKTTWFYTPNREYADLTALGWLPAASLQVTARFFNRRTAVVTVHNPGDKIAFFVELAVVGERSGKTKVPVFWEDNYISLLPGETRTLLADFPEDDGSDRPMLRCRGWNVPAIVVK